MQAGVDAREISAGSPIRGVKDSTRTHSPNEFSNSGCNCTSEDETSFLRQKRVHLLDLRREIFEQYIQQVTEPTPPNSTHSALSDKLSATTPLEEIFSERQYAQYCALLLAFYLLVLAALVGVSFGSEEKQAAAQYRLSTLEEHGIQQILQPTIEEIGLLLPDGCMRPLTMHGNMTLLDATLRDQSVSHKGWWFRTQGELQGELNTADAVTSFKLEGSDDGVHWDVHGGSTWKLKAWGGLSFGTGRLGQTVAAGQILRIEHYPGWHWILVEILCPASICLGVLVAAVLAHRFLWHRATQACWITSILVVSFYFAATVGVLMAGHPLASKNAPVYILYAIASLWLPLSLDKLLLSPSLCLSVTGTLVLVARIVEATLLGIPELLLHEPPLVSVALLAAGAASVARAHVRARRGRNMVEHDERVLNERWRAVVRGEEEQLERLTRRTEAMQSHAEEQRAERRQLSLKLASVGDASQPMKAALAAVRERSIESTELDGGAPVQSMEQLLVQGRVVAPVLRWKALSWARQSHAMLSLQTEEGRPEAVEWRAAMQDVRLRGGGGGGGGGGVECKSRTRALEKAVRRYRSDVSRLLDIARQRMLFGSVSDLLACLDAITRDPDARVVFVRNGMLPRADAAHTAGYRHVKVNLRIESRLTRALGVDGHVCEILLVLKELAVLQTAESHQRYLQYRDLQRPIAISFAALRRKLATRWRQPMEQTESNAPPSEIIIEEDRALPSSTPTGPEAPTPPASPVTPRRVRISSVADVNAEPSMELAELERGEACEEGRALVTEQVRGLTCLPTGFLQQQVSEFSNALASANSDSLLFTSRPIIALVSRRRWQIITAIIAFLLVLLGIQWLGLILDTHRGMSFRQYRFTPLELRDGTVNSPSTPIASPHIGGFHLLKDNCRIPHVNYTLTTVGASMILTILNEEPPLVNGWALQTAASDPEQDPVRFKFEARAAFESEEAGDDAGSDGWVKATNMNSLHDSRGSVLSHEVLPLDTPSERGAMTSIDMRVRTAKLLTHTTLDVLCGVMLFLMVFFGRAGRAELALVTWILLTVCAFALQAAAAALYFPERTENGVYWLLYSLPALFFSVVTVLREDFVITAVLCGGIFVVAWDITAAVVLFKEPISVPLTDPSLMGCFFVGFSAVAHLYRARSAARCRQLIARDKATYDKVFQRIREQPGGEDRLGLLAARVSGLVEATAAQNRQLNMVEAMRQLVRQRRRLLELQSPSFRQDKEHRRPRVNQIRLRGSERTALEPAPMSARSSDDDLTRTASREGRRSETSEGERPTEAVDGVAAGTMGSDAVQVDLGWAAEHFLQGDGSASAWRQLPSEGGTSDSMFGRTASASSQESDATSNSRRKRWRKTMKMAAKVQRVWSRLNRPKGQNQLRSGLLDPTSPVTCLDQLFAQARGLDPILRRKVQEWALASRGKFPIKRERSDGSEETAQFVKWEDARGVCEDQVKWGQLKSPDRAIEKLLRSYRQDVSCLLDVCRQHMVFETVDDLEECVKAIEADDDVVVVRVKNRMDIDYNSASSAGYRDVAISLRVETEETRGLGLAGHVCELQLQLEEFARLRNNDGHARYVRYRNFKAQ